MNAEGAEVRGRDQVPPDPLRAPGERDAERHRRDVSERRGEELVQLAVSPVVRIRRRKLKRDQLLRIGDARNIAEDQRIHLGVGGGADGRCEPQRDQGDGRKSWRAGQDSQAVSDVAAQFRGVLGGDADGEVEQNPKQPGGAVSLNRVSACR